ncbi:MAG: DUF3524 domain-containing protein [Aureliella sp.]
MHHVLVLEPFGGGSHRSLYEGWKAHSRHRFSILELPAVHWKWRSRHSSLTLACDARRLIQGGEKFDVVFCSDMLNLPEWKGLAGVELSSLPCVVYFHENQFTYPLSPGEIRDYHFAYSNLLTWVCADAAWFNSEYHLQDFDQAARKWLRRMPDFPHLAELDEAQLRTRVLTPGISPPVFQKPQEEAGFHVGGQVPGHHKDQTTTIGWVSRWEHDKRPDLFCRAVRELLRQDQNVELILLGQQYSRKPQEMEELISDYGDQIRHDGHVADRQQYWNLLSAMDLVVSTADHEFFGVGVLEAVWAGATPLLPRTLAYPEVFDLENRCERKPWFYSGELNVTHLQDAVERIRCQNGKLAQCVDRSDLQKYCWSELAEAYDDELDLVISRRA